MDSPCIKQTVCKVLKIFQYGKYLVAYVLKVFSTHQWKIDTYLYLPTLQSITADYICKQFGPRSGPTKCPLLIIFANSLDPDQAQQKVLCWLYLQTVWTQIRPNKMSSADYICKQFGPRSVNIWPKLDPSCWFSWRTFQKRWFEKIWARWKKFSWRLWWANAKYWKVGCVRGGERWWGKGVGEVTWTNK